MATRRDYPHDSISAADTDPAIRMPPVAWSDATEYEPAEPADPAAAWVAPQHRIWDVHTILTLLYVALTAAAWLAASEQLKDARMPLLLFGIGAVGPYWFGTRK